ncbi:putative transcription factor C2H2 family [Helianthus annuus]|nr:putative transcription factor C2H2 family [Helianthus annuus]
MEDAQRLINPWVLHLQKLGLELKCPICLQLFNRPVLLPCSHIFCSSCQIGMECAVCKHSYIDRVVLWVWSLTVFTEVKPAPFMENIVSIFRNLEATFTSHVIHPVCSDIGKASVQDVNNSSKKENGVTTKEGNSSNDQSTTLQTVAPDLTFGSLETLEKCITPESVKKQEFKASGSSSKVQVAHDKHVETRVDGVGFIPMEQLSPPLSCSDPNSNHEV